MTLTHHPAPAHRRARTLPPPRDTSGRGARPHDLEPALPADVEGASGAARPPARTAWPRGIVRLCITRPVAGSQSQ